jgi:hypothetical protein
LEVATAQHLFVVRLVIRKKKPDSWCLEDRLFNQKLNALRAGA